MDFHLSDFRDGAAVVAQGQLAQEVLHLLQVPPAARPKPSEGEANLVAEIISSVVLQGDPSGW